MDPNWNDNQPIYRQLRDRMVALILEGALKEGDPLPSVRAVAADYRLNPLTVLKGYQQLVDENLVEKRRGRGMYVSEGARRLLLAGERERFLHEEWPHDSGGHQQARIFRSGIVCANTGAYPPRAAAPRQRLQRRMRPIMPPLIEARDLTKKYGSHTALDRANFTVEPGRIVGLIGPNGAGKTSALRAILGLTDYRRAVVGAGPRAVSRAHSADVRRLLHRRRRGAALMACASINAIDFVAGVHPQFRRDRARHCWPRPRSRASAACANCPRA